MNVGISTRLAFPLIVLSVLLLGLGVGAAVYVRNLQQNSVETVTNHMASVRAAYELEVCIREFRRNFFRYLHDGDPRHLEPAAEFKIRLDYWMSEAERLAYSSTEQEQMRRVRNTYTVLLGYYDRLTREPLPKNAWERYRPEIDALLQKEFLEPAEEYQKVNERSLERNTVDHHDLAGRLIAGLIGVGVCGAAGGLLVGWLIASSVRRSIRHTERQLRSTAMQLNRVAGAKSGPPEAAGNGELDAAVQCVSRSAAAVLERLDRSQRDALRAEQLAYVGQMAAGIAHEVRNPLMAMKILVQKAGERPADVPFPPRDFHVLESEIERVERIITHFLEFARPPRIEKQVLQARPLLERVVGSLRARAEQQQIHLTVSAPAKPIFLDVDVGQFQQVFYNLIINALDALPLGGEITIELSMSQSHPEIAPTALIRVLDDGPGLPPDLGARIFEPFISSKDAGMGLGLSICARIVGAHGGDIAGANRPEGGAVFTVRLPSAARPIMALAN